MLFSVTAYANVNIALIKYWGKLDSTLNLPQVGSLSLTLDCFGTTTKVQRLDAAEDRLDLNGVRQCGHPLERIQHFLDRVRALDDVKCRFWVESNNTVPTASGLASSSSGFAALALATSKLIGLDLSPDELSQLARQGSGSAARSIWSGFSAIKAAASYSDNVAAYPIEAHPDLNVHMVVAECTSNSKAISSTKAMQQTKQSSPYYQAWVDTHSQDLQIAIRALQKNDFAALGMCMEHSTIKMHACMMAASPSISYFEPLTVLIVQHVRKLRQQGLECYFTIDAGPHVKILCHARHSDEIANFLRGIPGVLRVVVGAPGHGAHLVETI